MRLPANICDYLRLSAKIGMLPMFCKNYIAHHCFIQEEALSNASTLDYDALVSDFGDDSKDSSMIPDNESEV